MYSKNSSNSEAQISLLQNEANLIPGGKNTDYYSYFIHHNNLKFTVRNFYINLTINVLTIVHILHKPANYF